MIMIISETNELSMDVSAEEIKQRLAKWKRPKRTVTRGVLAKYEALVGDASHGIEDLETHSNLASCQTCRPQLNKTESPLGNSFGQSIA